MQYHFTRPCTPHPLKYDRETFCILLVEMLSQGPNFCFWECVWLSWSIFI